MRQEAFSTSTDDGVRCGFRYSPDPRFHLRLDVVFYSPSKYVPSLFLLRTLNCNFWLPHRSLPPKVTFQCVACTPVEQINPPNAPMLPGVAPSTTVGSRLFFLISPSPLRRGFFPPTPTPNSPPVPRFLRKKEFPELLPSNEFPRKGLVINWCSRVQPPFPS